MIYLVGQLTISDELLERESLWATPRWQSIDFEEAIAAIREMTVYQFDVETTVTQWWCTKRLITLQFGDVDGRNQWVLQWSALTPQQRAELGRELGRKDTLKLIHNAMFEIVVCLFHDIRIRNVFCTMLAEMMLYCGLGNQDEDIEEDETDDAAGFYALSSLSERYLCRPMNKAFQLSFSDDVITLDKLFYAANDVVSLGAIWRMQKLDIAGKDLEYVAALEMEAVLGYGEMTYRGMEIDVLKWLDNLELALPIQQASREKLNDELVREDSPFRKAAIEKGFFFPNDQWIMKWTNHSKKAMLVERFFPFLKDQCSNTVLVKLLDRWKNGRVQIPEVAIEWIVAFKDADWIKVQDACIATDRQWLIDNGFILPAGSVRINWNSWQQVLPMFQVVNKKLPDLSRKSMGSFHHPIGIAYREYKDNLKLTTTYGQAFIDKHREPDGKVRTSFNQIVSTGRVSSRRPNMQNIPVREYVGTRYRNAFRASAGMQFVSGDYASQELVIIAFISGEPLWNEALKKRQDLHSVCAELVFKKQWEAAKEEGCVYYATDRWSESAGKWESECESNYEWYKDWKTQPRRAKCKCKGHKKLREPVKNIDFGMAYGMSKYKLAGDMRWSVDKADGIINDYFKTFKSLGRTLTYLGQFGLWRGYIQTLAPFYRKRWFPLHHLFSPASVEAHIKDVRYDKTLGSIERESKNMPIQGTSADITKLSLILLYWKIHDELCVSDKVHLVCQVHDQNDTNVVDDYVGQWTPVMEQCMLDAALFVIPNGLLRVEMTTSPVWTK